MGINPPKKRLKTAIPGLGEASPFAAGPQNHSGMKKPPAKPLGGLGTGSALAGAWMLVQFVQHGIRVGVRHHAQRFDDCRHLRIFAQGSLFGIGLTLEELANVGG